MLHANSASLGRRCPGSSRHARSVALVLAAAFASCGGGDSRPMVGTRAGAGGKGGAAGKAVGGAGGAAGTSAAGTGGGAGVGGGGTSGGAGTGGSAGTGVAGAAGTAGGGAGGSTAGTGGNPPPPPTGGMDAGAPPPAIDAALPPAPPPPPPPTPNPGPDAATIEGLLAYEPFTGAVGALDGLSDGLGWREPWSVQNATKTGFLVQTATPLVVAGLASDAPYAVGGIAYQGSGRTLDVSAGGRFANYLTPAGFIGKAGTTLWISALLRLDTDKTTDVHISFHSSNAAWWEGDPNWPSKIGLGTYRETRAANGGPTWGLAVLTPTATDPTARAVYDSKVPAVIGQAALLVASIDFGATGGTVKLWVNPGSLGGAAPATPLASATATVDLSFKALSWYPGDDTNLGSLDEVRLGTSFASVTPKVP